MKLVQLAQIAFILLASVAVYAFVRASQNDYRYTSCQALCQLRPNYAGMERKVPDFTLSDMSGTPVAFSSFLGKGPVVLNFWTRTCKPCLEEMPELAAMTKILEKRGVKVVTISTDDGPDDVRDALAVLFGEEGPPFPVLFDPDMEVVTDMFGTTLFPETWLLDKHGVIRARIDGNPAEVRGMSWTDPMPLEVIEMIGRPGGCPVDFRAGKPVGPQAALCGEE
jgi:peroxiredoxin